MKITKNSEPKLMAKELGSINLPRFLKTPFHESNGEQKWENNPAYERCSEAYEEIDKWLKACQGRATERTVDRADLESAIKDVKTMMANLRAPLYALKGCTVEVNPYGQMFPRAYRFTPMSSWITIRVDSKGAWYFKVDRQPCRGDISRLPRFIGGIPEQILENVKKSF